jgi:hypothetical protein
MAAKRRRRRSKAKSTVRTRHQSESPLQVLKRRGALSVYELQAADEILAAHAMESGSPVARDPDLGITLDLRPDAADDQAARRSDLLRVYTKWRAELAGRVEQGVVRYVLFSELTLRQVDEKFGQRHGTAKRHLLAGLRHFAALRGNVPRGARGWKLTGAADQSSNPRSVQEGK